MVLEPGRERLERLSARWVNSEGIELNNPSAPAWEQVTVSAPGEANVTGNVFVPRTHEQFTHDLNGNLTADGRWSFSWDAENRLVTLVAWTSVGPQQSIRFDYDAQGRRIRKRVWNNLTFTGTPVVDLRFVYDGWNLIAEVGPGGSLVRSYVWGLDLSGSLQGAGGVGGLLQVNYYGTQTTNCFVSYDGNGNVTALVNAADGKAVAQYEYGPFGEVLRASGPMARLNPMGFSTKYQDAETDLLYYGYRFYNPSLGRWLSRDPVGEDAPLTASLPSDGMVNLYSFVDCDPQNRVDNLGLLQIVAVFSSGWAFRDPLYASIGAQVYSGFRPSSDAFYFGWGSPLSTSICNSGPLLLDEILPFPTQTTSFLKAWMLSLCPGRYRVTCRAELDVYVWGTMYKKVFTTLGQMLGEPIRSHETVTVQLGPDSYFSMFSKSVTKEVTVRRKYTLYFLYMPVALQVKPYFQGGFTEQGKASCDISGVN